MFVAVAPQDLTLEDLALLREAVIEDNSGVTELQVAEQAVQGLAQFWRLKDESAHGLFVTQCRVQESGEKRLIVWLMAGSNLFSRKKLLLDFFDKIAQLNGCAKIECSVNNDTIHKLYTSRLGFSEESVCLIREVSHG